MPSVKGHRHAPRCRVVASGAARRQLAILTLGGALAAGSLGGCSTTQEKAAAHRAESELILEAREKRQEQKRKQKEKHEKGKG